jgi:hypothetical protein
VLGQAWESVYRARLCPLTCGWCTPRRAAGVRYRPLAWVVCAHTRRQFDDARARARRWVERLGGELLVLARPLRMGAVVRVGLVGAVLLSRARPKLL